MANFPTSLPSFSNPSSGNFLNSPAHASNHASNNDETVQIASKVGVSSSTPTANTFLKGTGVGQSQWTDVPVQKDWITDTDQATILFDLSLGAKHRVTLAANRILSLSNVLNGHDFILALTQDGSGGRTVTWFSGITWAGGSVPTLQSAANATDYFRFIQTGTNTYIGFLLSSSVLHRQGGDASDWSVGGTTNYVETNVIEQAGVFRLGDTSQHTITFPIAFSHPPIVTCAIYNSAGATIVIKARTATTVDFAAGTGADTNCDVHWRAIGKP